MMSRFFLSFMVVVLSLMVAASLASAAEGTHSRKMLWIGYPGGGGGGGAAAASAAAAAGGGGGGGF